MDILIKHGTSNITQYVIAYNREHNICTGIGTLEITLSGTYPTAVNPHDTISVYENSDFKVKYYVSDIDRNAPSGTILLHCQDKSKYLVDYFIPDQYTVDYPSYTRYWIEKFFDEAGISYSFNVSSQGNLLSNYTVLGLQPAYDQIMMLMQLSGWYFYFDGNGTAIIGSLTTELDSAGSINNTDILDIKKTTDDKMLRNRAVVWGQYDPLRHEFAYADVSVHTPWNYDNRDERTMVISNNNIPNKSSAYDIANILIKEFARATITKEITVDGARNYSLGEVLRVSSKIWNGRGLITTFGVSMDRSGLVTKVILDERCPRLFGFFDFGDYVYVATFGDGIWRKHIKFDPTWYNFSTGLTNLEITDMHINYGIYGSVGSAGEMYYAAYDLPWNQVEVESLISSRDDNVASGVDVVWTTFSGVKARATIVDKITNTVKFGVDTASGNNYGDYFMALSGIMNVASGITNSGITTSGSRAWILEYDPFTGELVNNDYGGIYNVSYSGNYNFQVMDLENDGKNDYISVMTIGSGWVDVPSGGYDYGSFTTIGDNSTGTKTIIQDSHEISFFDNTSQFVEEGATLYAQLQTGVISTTFSMFENETIGESDVVWLSANHQLKRIRFSRVYDPTLGRTRVQSTTITSPTQSATGFGTVAKISKISSTVYRLWGVTFSGSSIGFTIKYRDWNTVANTLGAITTLHTFSQAYDPNSSSELFVDYRFFSLEDKIYCCALVINPSHSPLGGSLYNFIDIYKCEVNTITSSASSTHPYHIDFHTSAGNIGIGDWHLDSMTGGYPYNNPLLFKTANGVGFAFFIRENDVRGTGGSSYDTWLISSSDGDNFQLTNIQHTINDSDATFLYTGTHLGWQLTGERFFSGIWNSTSGLSYLFNGSTVTISNIGTTKPYWLDDTKIYTTIGRYDTYYIAKNGSDWWAVNPHTLSLVSKFTFPVNYTITKPFSLVDTSNQLFWFVTNNTTTNKELLRTTWSSYSPFPIIPFSQPLFGFKYGIICGKIFLDYDNTGIKALYVDNQLIAGPGSTFMVLQRGDGEDFHLIEEEAYPIRTDISNNSPVLTVGSGASSFHSNFVYANELVTVVPAGADTLALNDIQVTDYRYALLETNSGVPVVSGYPTSMQVIFVTESGIYTGDAQTYSGGFIATDSIPAGTPGRIETTNFTNPSQFIFVTTSGDNPQFYQKDNDKLAFVLYSGLPDSRATIIRCDDFV